MTLAYLSKEWRPTLLVVSFVFGVVFFSILTEEYFDLLVPFHLWLSFFLVTFQRDNYNSKLLFFFLISAGLGFLAEYIGVNYGVLFGDYRYSGKMGTLIGGVPITIALMWFLLNYTVGVFVMVRVKPFLLKILLGASLVVVVDVLLEPLAIKLGWWSWLNGDVPLLNYATWFITSCIILTAFNFLFQEKRDKIAIVYLFATIMFFSVMNLLTENS